MGKWGKYIFILVLTAGLFAVSWYASFYFNQRRITEMRSIQEQIATDILSSETDFSLLQELSCDNISQTITSEQLGSLAGRISFTEENIGSGSQIDNLKKQYTLLQVKDFLLKKRISERCKTSLTTVLYFYGTAEACKDCTKQGYVLDAAREKYPDLRIYSFDYDLDLSTIRAMKSIYKVVGPLPALVVNGKTSTGFKTLEELEALLPKEFVKAAAQEKAAAAKAANTATVKGQ
jgi:hypothetical protein